MVSVSMLGVHIRCGGGDDGAGFEIAGPVKEERCYEVRWKKIVSKTLI